MPDDAVIKRDELLRRIIFAGVVRSGLSMLGWAGLLFLIVALFPQLNPGALVLIWARTHPFTPLSFDEDRWRLDMIMHPGV